MALEDQIWREDISDESDYVRSLTRTLHDLVLRATYQKAPPELVTRLTRLRDLSAQLYDELEELKPYFPQQ
jgi:hypothetical protein